MADDWDTVYTATERVPKYNVAVSPLSAGYSTAGRMLRRRLPQYTKAQHITAGDQHIGGQLYAKAEHNALVNEAIADLEQAGIEMGPLISGIVSNNFPAGTKDKLRELAHASSRHGAAAFAHYAAARLRLLAARETAAQVAIAAGGQGMGQGCPPCPAGAGMADDDYAEERRSHLQDMQRSRAYRPTNPQPKTQPTFTNAQALLKHVVGQYGYTLYHETKDALYWQHPSGGGNAIQALKVGEDIYEVSGGHIPFFYVDAQGDKGLGEVLARLHGGKRKAGR